MVRENLLGSKYYGPDHLIPLLCVQRDYMVHQNKKLGRNNVFLGVAKKKQFQLNVTKFTYQFAMDHIGVFDKITRRSKPVRTKCAEDVAPTRGFDSVSFKRKHLN